VKKTTLTALKVGSAPLVLGLAMISTSAYAQDAAVDCAATPDDAACDDANTIVVTGSILRRTDTETPSPVTILNAETLETRGINTVAEGIQRLAANGSGTVSEGWNNGSNFATGANGVSLRGLTVQKTLTMFDGLRMAPYPLADDGHRNFVDLNTVPDAIVERVEILKDGASSTYGADAVAGVVNVITKKQVQGLHLNASAGISQRGDGAEQRFDATYGYGDLDDQGFNIYVSGSYRKNREIYARDRDYPFNSADLSKICLSGTTLPTCMVNGVQFGINADGSLGAGTTTIAPLVAPATAAGARTGAYQLLNTAGCSAFNLNPVTLTAAQAGTTWNVNQCQQDLRAQYSTLRPQSQRYGFSARATARLGDKAELYITGNYQKTETATQIAPVAFNSQTTAPQVLALSPVVLPVYVCAAGVGTIPAGGGSNVSTGCTAANGVLNPNNPFAAAGSSAILRGRYDKPRGIYTDNRALRGAIGIHGTFGSDDSWDYSAEFTASNVQLQITQTNYLIPQRIADVAAQGTYNFVSPWLNTQAQRDYIAPTNKTVSNSDLWQVQATLAHKLMELPGGALQAAAGVAYRHESINNPSANPANLAHPFDRYYGVNAVGAVGARNVKSAFYEIGAPIVEQLELNASGRYDDYSSGQTNFSPKFGAKFTPIRQLSIRGTWSKGFRIPSFNEAYGLPTTGFQTANVNCVTYAAFCTAHGNNTYATAAYSIGRTATGNPALRPEKSTSWTLGAVIEPMRNISFTVDYYNIKTRDLVGGVSATQFNAAIDQYYRNNGVVNVPGITAVRPQIADAAFPTALPLLGFIEYAYINEGEERVQGLDFGADIKHDFGGVTWTSSLDANYVIKYELQRGDGSIERYDGTLSPCDYTSCSGSPKWRATWQNTLDFGKFALTATTYYTGPYDLASTDYGSTVGHCQQGIRDPGDEIAFYKVPVGSPAGTAAIPVKCEVEATWNVDLSATVKVNDNFTLYANVLNVLGIKPPFDPSGAYQITQYNPAWAQANAVGRYFRVGARVNF
jgi:iron complex outermembrane receptor protein